MFTHNQIIIYYFVILICFNLYKTSNCSRSGHSNIDDKAIKICKSNVSISYVSKCCDKQECNEGYTTSGQQVYKNRFASSSLKCFSFRIKVCNQTHIGLFSNGNQPKTNPWIETVVGGLPDGLGNIFRKNGADISSTYNQKQNSLNPYEYRGFWISWVNGNIKVGYRGKPAFMSWQDPSPFTINYVGVDTCCGTIGHVVVEDPKCPGINM